jgi:hypothetical protein
MIFDRKCGKMITTATTHQPSPSLRTATMSARPIFVSDWICDDNDGCGMSFRTEDEFSKHRKHQCLKTAVQGCVHCHIWLPYREMPAHEAECSKKDMEVFISAT